MTDAAIIALYLKRSEQAIAESQNAYGPYCYRVAEGILHNASDSEESVNDTWLAAWDSIPPACPQSLRAYLGTLTRQGGQQREAETGYYWPLTSWRNVSPHPGVWKKLWRTGK